MQKKELDKFSSILTCVIFDISDVLIADSPPESNVNWNDRSMIGSSSYFKPTTQKQTVSSLETEPALQQLLGMIPKGTNNLNEGIVLYLDGLSVK